MSRARHGMATAACTISRHPIAGHLQRCDVPSAGHQPATAAAGQPGAPA
jgi:hypothetical protein